MNVIPFFDKAIENLEIAEICSERGKYNACANRAYYAMYHAALAALAHEGIKPTQDIIKHGWVHSTFHKELINRRKLYPTLKSALQDVQEIRFKADYKEDSVTRKEGNKALRTAILFLEVVGRRVNPK
jgi:uncharacterized protein (UPF0332 family)